MEAMDRTFEELFRPRPLPEGVRHQAASAGWPAELLERASELRLSPETVERWLREGRSARDVRRGLDQRDRVLNGTLRLRLAVLDDEPQLRELFANSPEEIGDWLVTVERSPYPWAQFRLQENSYLLLVEDQGVILGARAMSSRNTIVDGKQVSVGFRSAARVRIEARGRGYSQMGDFPIQEWFDWGTYYYLRSGNFGSLSWIRHQAGDVADLRTEKEDQMPGVPVRVDCFPATKTSPSGFAIRPATASDLRRCVALINRTHRGLDLFRPYTTEFLSARLGDPYWGPKPPRWVKVYGWDDFHVVERDGRVVACGGLWDQGRHVREVWQHKSKGERRVVDSTCLMDWGFERGCEAEVASLVEHFIGETTRLGRTQLKAALQFAPAVRDQLAPFGPQPEERFLVWYITGADQTVVDRSVKRPYTDLGYW